MLNKIANCPDLDLLRRNTCEENDIRVTICDELMENGALRRDLIAILKIDAYYSTSRMPEPPKSIDCLIIIKTGEREFGLTLVELKKAPGSGRARQLKPGRIKPKFDNTIKQFLSGEFAHIFMNSAYTISDFRLWLVTNRTRTIPLKQERKKTGSSGFDAKRWYTFMGKEYEFERIPPDEAWVGTGLA
uniref:Uncharacterized protein n=1 Tax=Candidatus Kentrum sp. LFY TaxID=2126342 RepID=A0A450UFQ6_9GAMM|nr:MAG: hypothetical protein BECKLFY1418A_GA0070994_101528 [Candidatus Kentron sp. LFY]